MLTAMAMERFRSTKHNFDGQTVPRVPGLLSNKERTNYVDAHVSRTDG